MTYALSALLATYLNVFVLIVQVFTKMPALTAIAPRQFETPFVLGQLLVLAAFIALSLIVGDNRREGGLVARAK